MKTPTSKKAYWQLIDLKNVGKRANMEPPKVRRRAYEYFKMCLENYNKGEGINPTLTGLAYHMGFNSIAHMNKMKMDQPEFQMMVDKSKLLVENYYESRGGEANQHSVTFAIFALKNLGWIDAPAIVQNAAGVAEVIVTFKKPGKKSKQLKDGKLVAMVAS